MRGARPRDHGGVSRAMSKRLGGREVEAVIEGLVNPLRMVLSFSKVPVGKESRESGGSCLAPTWAL